MYHNTFWDTDYSTVEEQDLPAWAFARRHGFAEAFDAQDLRELLKCEVIERNRNDDEQHELLLVSEEMSRSLKGMLDERLDINDEAAQLLYWIMKSLDEQCFLEVEDILKDERARDKKNEGLEKLPLPFLRTDDELDKLRVQRLSRVSITRHGLKRLYINIENDEGMEWSETMLSLPQKMLKNAEGERLEIPRDMLHDIQSFMVDDWTEEDGSETLRTASLSKKRRRLDPVTPPLTPRMFTPRRLSDASTVGIDLDPTSDARDPDMHHLEATEAQMDRENTIFEFSSGESVDTNELAHLYPPLSSALKSSASRSHRFKLGDLKVESPVMIDTPPAHKPVFDKQAVKQDMEAHSSPAHLWSGETDSIMLDAMEIMQSLGAQANVDLQQEQLTEADALLRIAIPILPACSHVIIPPWEVYSRAASTDVPFTDEVAAQKRLLWEVTEDTLQNMTKWSGASALEMHMRWRPFANHAAEHVLEEKIDEGEYMAGIMSHMTMQDVVTSDSNTWKLEDWRVFDDLVDAEDLEPADFNTIAVNVDSLIRQRRDQILDIDRSIDRQCSQSVPNESTVFAPPQRTFTASKEALPAKMDLSASATLSAGLMSKFLSLHSIQAKSPKTVPATKAIDAKQAVRAQQRVVNNGQNLQSEAEKVKPLKLPPIAVTLSYRSFIIGTELMQNRRTLYRQLEQLYGTANFIERDFTSLQPQRPSKMATQQSKLVAYDPSAEADILLSPSTGLIMTTLQKIQQQSLPIVGSQRTPFHDRIRQLCVRYEHLIILVAQTTAQSRPSLTLGQQEHSMNEYVAPPMTSSDITALARLHVLTASLPCNILVQLVPGAEREVAGWTVFHMNNVPLPSTNLVVPVDESYWELILRRAGMNAYAACIVLGMLQRTENTSLPFGLPAFLQMRPDARISMFAGVLGGEKVLRRVNACLEREWISQSRGYKKH